MKNPLILGSLILIIVSILSQNFKKETMNKGDVVMSPSPLSFSSPTPSPSDRPTSMPHQVNKIYSQLIYPGSKLIKMDDLGLVLESTENPSTITAWYKERIINMGMKSKSFVTTNTNNNVLNKLVGASVDKEVAVEINKSTDTEVVRITIKESSSI